jgi:hypothetical protein
MNIEPFLIFSRISHKAIINMIVYSYFFKKKRWICAIYLKWSLLRHNEGQNSLFSLFSIDMEEKSAAFWYFKMLLFHY